MTKSECLSHQNGGSTSNRGFKAILLAATLVLTAGAFVMLSDAEESDASYIGGSLQWEVVGNTLIISGSGDMQEYGQLLPYPWFIDYYNTVEHITLKEGITSLAKGCFKFPNLKGEIVLPKSLEVIGTKAFEGTGITSLVIPEGSKLTKINTWAFLDCKELTGTLNLPKSVTYIGNEAFKGCSKMTGTVQTLQGMTYINTGIFEGCSSLTGDLKVDPNIWYVAHRAFDGCSGITGELNLTNDYCLGVWDNAFRGCTGLTGVTMFHCISGIGDSAFEGCTGLKTVRVNDGSIESRAFAGCTNLIEVDIGSKIKSIDPTAFEGITFYDEDGKELALSNDNLNEFVGYMFEGSNGKLTRSGTTSDILPDLPDDEDKGFNIWFVALPIVFIVGLAAGLLIGKVRRP